ncbi:MAG: hypothetical protein K8W52_18450 [Deltaproteobacteria bacterium]|nr:hypothetical protein [Deltaproteobacteria bacterium]
MLAAFLIASVSSAGCTIAARKHRGLGFTADALAVVGGTLTVTQMQIARGDGDDAGGATGATLAVFAVAGFLGLMSLGVFDGDPPAGPVAKGAGGFTPVAPVARSR